jgi:hypothetical protein
VPLAGGQLSAVLSGRYGPLHILRQLGLPTHSRATASSVSFSAEIVSHVLHHHPLSYDSHYTAGPAQNKVLFQSRSGSINLTLMSGFDYNRLGDAYE